MHVRGVNCGAFTLVVCCHVCFFIVPPSFQKLGFMRGPCRIVQFVLEIQVNANQRRSITIKNSWGQQGQNGKHT